RMLRSGHARHCPGSIARNAEKGNMRWCAGRQGALQGISDLIELETGKRVTDLLVTCCRLWQRLGLVELSTGS
ncbi:MAG TPA: hypothetical protein VJ714_01610, partial [Anaerolineae bacterium]|nr:hypothetical protein [Anaerolineae bacterium]